MTLWKLQLHFRHLYGRRNRVYMPSRRTRIDFLNLAIGDLQEAIRKNSGDAKLGIALARVVSRTFCVAEAFFDLSIPKAMARKYRSEGCGYCNKFPCQCIEKRPNPVISAKLNLQQLQWSLNNWCAHFRKLYGDKNKEKGIENIINRLFKEISELQSLELEVYVNLEMTIDKAEDEFGFELADVLAWTIATANFYKVDLEKSVWDRYGTGCGKCRQCPCICGQFRFHPVKWELI